MSDSAQADGDYVLSTSPESMAELRLSLANVCCDRPPSICTCRVPITPDDLVNYPLTTVYALETECWHCVKQGDATCPGLRAWVRTYWHTSGEAFPDSVTPCAAFRLDEAELYPD